TDLKLYVNFPKEAAAREALWPARDLLAVARLFLRPMIQQLGKADGTEHLVPFLKEVETSLRAATVGQVAAALQGGVHLKPDAATLASTTRALAEATFKIRRAAERMTSVNNLKQIALAFHNYHDAFGAFPANAIYGKDGKPLLSWRVAILPF